MKPPDKPMKEFQDMNKVMEMMGQSGNVAQDRNTVPSQTTLLLLLTDCVRYLGMLSYMEADRGCVQSAQVIDALAARIAKTVKQMSSTVTLKSETLVAQDESTDKGQIKLSVILDEIEERANKATQGPWDSDTDDLATWVNAIAHPQPLAKMGRCTHFPTKDNADFIAASRTDIPALVKIARMWTEELRFHGRGKKLTEITAILTQREP